MLTPANLCIFYITTEDREAGVASDGTKDTQNFIKISQYVPKFKDTYTHSPWGSKKHIFFFYKKVK